MTHVLNAAVFLFLLQPCSAIKTINCSTFGNHDDTKVLKIAAFCTTDPEEKDNCKSVSVDNRTEPADEVLYQEDRDKDRYIGCRNNKWTDETRVCRLDKSLECDGVSQCDTDECICAETIPETQLFYCPNTTVQGQETRGGCITDEFLCNGYSHCPNDHDEALCYRVHTCKNEEYGRKEYVPNYRVCDGYYHCEDFSDEDPNVCRNYNVSEKAPRKYIRCLDEDLKEIKIKITDRCNGVRKCHHQCLNYSVPYNEGNCTAWSDEDGCGDGEVYKCDGDSGIRIPADWVCDTYPQCPFGDDECTSGCDYSRFWESSPKDKLDRVNITEYFNSTPGFCKNFDLEKVNCSESGNHFDCETVNKCVPQIGVCNTLDNCGDWSDEKGCPGRFYCTNENPLYVPWENVCDGAADCLDGSDECQNCNFDILANDQSLIANDILSSLVWVMGIIALLGNLILILTKGNELKSSGQKMNSVTKISTLLLVNLAMSDFLMGVYLIGIAAMERKLNGKYCQESKRWRSSFSCKLFGSICLLSSECSIFMMTLITLHRLISVIFPRKISTLGRRGLIAWYVSIIAVWITVLCLAWVPNMHAFQEYFVSEAYYENNSFIGKGDKKTLRRYAWIYNKTSPGGTEPPDDLDMSWDTIFRIIEQSGRGATYIPYGLMGFYSSHGVCLHKLFTTTEVSSWSYSLFLNMFNSICFVFIVVSYSYILTVSKKLTSKSKGSSRMARKIQRLILTDALCWIPTCICAYLYIAGVKLSTELYAYTAILILPINSCLNPIVYTDIIDLAHVFILKHVLRMGSDDFHSTPSHALGDKINNPVHQLTTIHDSCAIQTVPSPHVESSYHLQVV
ncbi:hypothetical protein ACHWQZ_G003615 [Mnemiopsis leidyi]